jgi:hypothetical protein
VANARKQPKKTKLSLFGDLDLASLDQLDSQRSPLSSVAGLFCFLEAGVLVFDCGGHH